MLILAACAQENVAPPTQWPALHPTVEVAEPAPARRGAPIAVPDDLAPWTARAEEHELRPPRGAPPDAPDELYLFGKEVSVDIPGPFDPREFNQVELAMRCFVPTQVHVEFLRRGQKPLRSTNARGDGGALKQLVVDVPGTRLSSEPIDLIRVRAKGAAGGRILAGLTLCWSPPELALPRADGAPEMVRIGHELRRAVGLRSDVPLEADFDAPEGALLGFAAGVPFMERSLGLPHDLVVEISGRRERFALDDKPWRWFELEVEPGPNRVRFELESGGQTLALCALGQPQVYRQVTGTEPLPTALIVTSDTHRGDYLGASAAGVDVATPAIDALAARGVFFADCRASTNVTIPSHAALFTGEHPRDTGLNTNYRALSDAAPTLAEVFHAAGYATAAVVGTSHMLHEHSGLGQGFDVMIGPPDVADAAETVDAALALLQELDDRPLFLWVHLFDAHHPYEPPGRFDREYYSGGDPFDPALPEPGLDPALLPEGYAALRDLDFPVAQYRGEISYLDEELGRLLAAQRVGAGVIAITSDHGECLGEGDIWFDHAELYPPNLHVPLVLAWPGAPAGTRVEDPVSQIDVGRTLLNLAGLEYAPFPGQDVLGRERAPSPVPHFAISADCTSASVTLDGWHLILSLERHSRGQRGPLSARHAVELYDLGSDPGCRVDLGRQELERARALRAILVRWLGEAGGLGWSAALQLDDEALRKLGDLGYASSAGQSAGGAALFDEECGCPLCEQFR